MLIAVLAEVLSGWKGPGTASMLEILYVAFARILLPAYCMNEQLHGSPDSAVLGNNLSKLKGEDILPLLELKSRISGLGVPRLQSAALRAESDATRVTGTPDAIYIHGSRLRCTKR